MFCITLVIGTGHAVYLPVKCQLCRLYGVQL